MSTPRNPEPGEMPAIAELNDRVFFNGAPNEMFRRWPAVFSEANRRNLFVCVEEGRLLSHAGAAVRGVLIEGAETGVACIGCVCTDPEARGRGWATGCVEAICHEAHAQGADFALISGDLPIYRRMGAVATGFKYTVMIGRDDAARMADASLERRPAMPVDIARCAALHDRATTRFVRPEADWHGFFHSRMCINRYATLWLVAAPGAVPEAYLFVSHPREDKTGEILEIGGNTAMALGAVASIMDEEGHHSLALHLPDSDHAALACLRGAGVSLAPTHSDFGTTLLIDAPRLVERLAPVFQARAGRTASVEQDGDAFIFRAGATEHTVMGKADAARFIFGHPQEAPAPGDLAGLFPVPQPWFGLNYF